MKKCSMLKKKESFIKKSEADYRVSKPVADAYAVLDDYYCDKDGSLRKDALEQVMITFKNERDLYDRSKSSYVPSTSLARDAFMRTLNAYLEWDDETPHATKLSSAQVKNWFSSKGKDFKEELKPLVDAIDKQRKEWWGR